VYPFEVEMGENEENCWNFIFLAVLLGNVSYDFNGTLSGDSPECALSYGI